MAEFQVFSMKKPQLAAGDFLCCYYLGIVDFVINEFDTFF